jgi:hypothetical protein
MKKLIEVMQNSVTTKTYSLREVFVNPDFVVSLVPDTNTKRLLSEGRLPDGIHTGAEFTRIAIHKGASGQEMVVVGSVRDIRKKLYSTATSILKG